MTALRVGQVMQWNGSLWVNAEIGEALGVYDVRFYGARGDGTTDDTAAIQAAATAAGAAGGGRVYLPPGTYKITSRITLYSNVEVEMSSDATVDFSTAPTFTECFYALGTESTATLLTGNATIGALTVAVTADPGLARGDLVRIYSEAQFDSSQTDSEIGEINKVASVSGLTVTLEASLRDTYNTADTAALTKITPVRGVRIRGGTIQGGGTSTTSGSDADQYGVWLQLVDDCIVEDVRFVRCDRVGVQFKDAVWCKALHCRFENAVNDSTGYGISFSDACQDCLAHGNTFIGVRHSLSTNNASGDHGQPRRIVFAHNHVYASETSRAGGGGDAIDTHGAAEDIYIYHNVVYHATGQGINVECASARIVGNVIWHAGSNGINFRNESDREGIIFIDSNEVRGAAEAGIRVNAPVNGSTAKVRRVTVTNNHVEDSTTVGIFISDSSSVASIDYLNCSNNHVSRSDSTAASIQINRINHGVVSGNVISEPTEVGQVGLRLDTCVGLTVSNNVVRHATSATSVGIRLGTCTNCVLSGNIVGCTTPAGLTGIQLQDTSSECTVYGNDLSDTTTAISRGTGSGHDVWSDKTLAATIATGAVTITRNTEILTIDTESAAATDDLDTISGGVTGQVITVRSANGGRDPTIKTGTGNLTLMGRHCLLSATSESITLQYNGSAWLEIARAILTVEQSATIASGAITVNPDAKIVTVDTESAAATDDLDTISGGWTGQEIMLRCATGTRVPTVKDGVDNLSTEGDFALNSSADTIKLVFRSSVWLEVSRSNNA